MELLNKRINQSLEITEQMLSLCKKPYLSLSFGKDSLVMLDLVRMLKPDIQCYFLKSEETYLLYDYEDVINQYLNRGVKLELIETNRLSENNFDWEKARKAGNKDFQLIDNLSQHDGVFMGLRIEESKGRRCTLLKKENNAIGRFIMKYKDKEKYRCCPVAAWSAFEILHYLQERNLPRLAIYDSEGEKMRTTARLTGDCVRQHGLAWIKKNKPENFNKLISLIPDLRLYL